MTNGPKPEYGNRLTEGNEGNKEQTHQSGRALSAKAPRLGRLGEAAPPKAKGLQQRARRLLVLTAVTLLPAAAQAQGAIEAWVQRYDGPGNGDDLAGSLVVDDSGNAYVTGSSWGGGTYADYATIKYSGGNIDNWMPVEATVFGQPLPQECRLEQNYPNPFNATTVLSYQLPVASHVRLNVYDMAGRLVETLVDGRRSAGVHELTWDASDLPSGVYFAMLQAADYVGMQKLILLK